MVEYGLHLYGAECADVILLAVRLALARVERSNRDAEVKEVVDEHAVRQRCDRGTRGLVVSFAAMNIAGELSEMRELDVIEACAQLTLRKHTVVELTLDLAALVPRDVVVARYEHEAVRG